jgi:heterodisulfide reductase subunit A2
MKTGVFLCQTGTGDPLAISVHAVASYAGNLPNVEVVQDLGVLPRLDTASLADELRREGLERVVIAGDSPGFFKPTFTRAMTLAGGDPREVRLASFRAFGASRGMGTARAKGVLACAVLGVPYPLAAVPDTTAVNPATLIIGGGVAGIQAALEIADAGKQVHLVERTGTIGGHMAMFDKTFPTLDCAACILTPKMVAVGQHEDIHLMTYAEIEDVSGRPGEYKVKVRQKARRVDVEACVACHACMEVCPVRVPSEFDNGIAERKAIYMPFPQAVPNAYLIDASACTYVLSEGKKCGACAKKCPKECIDLDQQDEIVELEVGNVVLATGYDVYDATKIERYGYGTLPNVLTALEFERLTNASGPTGGKIVCKTKRLDKKTKAEEWVLDAAEGTAPRSVAIIHCVGSRDANHNAYCSRVCCMYSLKFAHLVKEKLPEADCYEFYIDMRAFGKGYEEFADRIKSEGTFCVRGRTAKVFEADGRMLLRGEDMVSEKLVEFPVDMVLLAVGLVPAHGTEDLARMLSLPTDEGWFSELDYNADPTDTERGGISVAGACQGPKDIPDTVAQASAVAAGVLKSIATGRGLDSRADLSLADIEARAASLVEV